MGQLATLALLWCGSTLAAEPASEPRAVGERYERARRFSGALAVAADGKPLFTGGFGLAQRDAAVRNGPETAFSLGSLTKQFTAAAILKLEADGRLRVEDPIAKHLPAYPRPQADRITLHHLLTHTSGIPSLWRLGDGLEEVEPSGDPVSLERLLSFFAGRELLFDPGARFRYSNSGYVVLAAVIEAVSEMSYADYLEEALFDSLGMDGTRCGRVPGEALPYQGQPPEIEAVPPEHPSWSVGDGCVRSTAADLLDWDAALAGDRLLPRAQIDKLFAPHAEIRPGLHYGYGWFLGELHGRPVARHSGAGEGVGADMVRFLDDRLTLVALTNYVPMPGVDLPGALIRDAAALQLGLPADLPPSVIDLSDEQAARLAGDYRLDVGGRFTILREQGALWFEARQETPGVFDYGELEDPGRIASGAERALDIVRDALAGRYDAVPVCAELRDELAPGELEGEWRELLPAADGAEVSRALAFRYPGEATLVAVSRVASPDGETFFALDLDPELEVCGWYAMDRGEFDVRNEWARPQRRWPLAALGPDELLVDGFNYRERDVRLRFAGDGEAPLRIVLEGGAIEHEGVAVTGPPTNPRDVVWRILKWLLAVVLAIATLLGGASALRYFFSRPTARRE